MRMNKHVLPGMSPIYENMARSVVQAHKKINGQNTAPTGTISIHRSNGSKDVYGTLNKDGYSVAKNVGDTAAPGRPLGISAKSVGGILYVSWDGELEGGLPSDFYCVRAYLEVEGKAYVIGELTSKGNLSYKNLGEGVHCTVYATAEDETCDEDGTPNHNVSEKSDEISVVGSQIPIQDIDVEYALGESQTTPPESGWSTMAPEWREGMYMWQRTVTYTSDGASYSDPTCIQGAAGKDGADGAKGDDGIGIKSVVEQYYLSTSSTTQSGGSWSVDQPEWSEGKYLWTRSQVTWTDDTVTTTAPVLAKAINKANENANEAIDKVEKINYYFWTDSSGAHVTTQPNDATTGPNILIDGNGFHIRQGEVETAFFKSNEIGLGSNSEKSVIRMCGGLGEIGTVQSSDVSVLALFGELVGLRGSSGSVVGNSLANLTLTDDDAVLTANGSIMFNSKTVYVGTNSLDSRVYLYNARGWIEPTGSTVDDTNSGISLHGKKSISLAVSAGTSSTENSGVYLQNSGDKYEDGILVLDVYNYLFGSDGSPVKSQDVYKAMRFENWKTLYQDDTYGWIRYRVFAGIVFLSGSVSGISGSWSLKFPSKYCPEFATWFPAAHSTASGNLSNNTAAVWLTHYSVNQPSYNTMYIYTNGPTGDNEFVNFHVCYPYCWS
nr:MAG TPA: tail protein [Caudoviricetes sp.]